MKISLSNFHKIDNNLVPIMDRHTYIHNKKLLDGCTSELAMNCWLKRRKCMGNIPLGMNICYNLDDMESMALTWKTSIHGTTQVILSKKLRNLLTDGRKHGKILTCGLHQIQGKPFRKGHYYCVMFDTLLRRFIIMNPNGNKCDRVRDQDLTDTLNQYFGWKYAPIRDIDGYGGPQSTYVHDKGYCGPWACILLAYMIRFEGDYKRTCQYITNEINLGTHVERMIRVIAEEHAKAYAFKDINGGPTKIVF